MDLTKQIEEAKARKAKALTALTEEDWIEKAQRDELAQIDREAKTAEETKRELDLARRLDAAHEALPDKKLKSVAPVEFPDTFVICYSGKAHSDYQNEQTRQMRREQNGQKANYELARRTYALAVVIDWNGRADYGELGDPDMTRQLGKYLDENPGLLTPITEAAATLAGIISEEKKSRT
jgi:hypothetical protein